MIIILTKGSLPALIGIGMKHNTHVMDFLAFARLKNLASRKYIYIYKISQCCMQSERSLPIYLIEVDFSIIKLVTTNISFHLIVFLWTLNIILVINKLIWIKKKVFNQPKINTLNDHFSTRIITNTYNSSQCSLIQSTRNN